MARVTPTPNRWPSNMNAGEETQPLLDHESHPKVSKLPARAVISKKTDHHSFQIDHGFLPWLQVFAGWILFANSWGLPGSYGAFQTYYATSLLPEQSASSIAWIGSIQIFFTTLMGLVGGIFIDRGYLQSLILAGTLLEVLGLLATSFSTQYWQLLLAQGVCVGLGSGILGLLPVAVIAMYFEERRMVAIGLAATSASFAGTAYPIALRYMFDKLGFPWSARILGLFILIVNAIPLITMRLQSEGAEGRSKFTLNHFKDSTYSAFVCAFTLIMASAFVPFFFIQEYALQLGVSESMAFNVLAIMNAAGTLGRFMPNFLADRYGGINTLLPLTSTCIILLGALPFVRTLSSLVAFSLLYGFASGGVIVLPAPIIASLSPNAAEIGTRMGLAYLLAAFGGLIGNPISSAVKNEDTADAAKQFRGVWWAACAIMSLSVVALLLTRHLKTGRVFGHDRV